MQTRKSKNDQEDSNDEKDSQDENMADKSPPKTKKRRKKKRDKKARKILESSDEDEEQVPEPFQNNVDSDTTSQMSTSSSCNPYNQMSRLTAKNNYQNATMQQTAAQVTKSSLFIHLSIFSAAPSYPRSSLKHQFKILRYTNSV